MQGLMYRTIASAGVAAGLLAFPAGAFAQTVGIGTTKGGATSQVSAGVATIVSKFAGLNMRTQPMAGTQQYIPAVNAGSLEFGVANIMQTQWAVRGEELSKGHPNPNLRMVATLMVFRTGAVVPKSSGITKVSELKGKRVPDIFAAAPLFKTIMAGILANGGTNYGEVQRIPASGLQQHWDSMMEDKLDVVVATVGSGYLELMDKKLNGIRFIQFDPSDAAVKRMTDILPGVEVQTIPASPKLAGMGEATRMMTFDYTLFAGKGVSDDVVYKVAKAMFENRKDLVAASPLWNSFNPETMGRTKGIEYHPGAIKLLKEKGAWKN